MDGLTRRAFLEKQIQKLDDELQITVENCQYREAAELADKLEYCEDKLLRSYTSTELEELTKVG